MKVVNIILRTDDVERSTAFWSEVVGLGISGQMPGYTFLDGGPITIILSRIEQPITDESFTEIVFASENVRETYDELASRGVPFEGELGPPIMSEEGRDLVAAFFRDPDGHYGRLTGWVDAE